MGQDWYRKTSWTAEDEADFRQRLARARKHNQAQYLRIQAGTLPGKSLAPAAIALYDEVLTQYPDNKIETAFALSGKAARFEELGRLDEASDSYLQSIAHLRIFPNVRVNSPLDFAWLVATKKLARHYETALSLLDEFNEYDTFPTGRFKYYGSRALILRALGETERAERDARVALAAADEKTSGFRYHPFVGVVGDRFIAERAMLAKIAGEPNWMLRILSYVNRCLGR